MISDVLSEAVSEIKDYLDSPMYRKVYQDHLEEINLVVQKMEELRIKLDNPVKEV